MSVILVNTTSRNIWIRQPLLAADIYEIALYPWQYHANLNREGNDIKINFLLTIPLEIYHDLHQGLQVKSYNPDISKDKSPLKVSHPYATHSKGEPPTLSLSTTAGVGSGELRGAQAQSVTFCSRCLGKPFWIKNPIKKPMLV